MATGLVTGNRTKRDFRTAPLIPRPYVQISPTDAGRVSLDQNFPGQRHRNLVLYEVEAIRLISNLGPPHHGGGHPAHECWWALPIDSNC